MQFPHALAETRLDRDTCYGPTWLMRFRCHRARLQANRAAATTLPGVGRIRGAFAFWHADDARLLGDFLGLGVVGFFQPVEHAVLKVLFLGNFKLLAALLAAGRSPGEFSGKS